MRYDLRPVFETSDREAYHRLRRQVLWDARGRFGYDDDHPDDRRPGHHPFVLKLDGVAIGTVRLDQIGEGIGAVRLVAIAPERQRLGHGRMLMGLVEAEAHRLGLRRLAVNAAVDAIGFYARLGWSPGPWADPSPGPGASEPMVKDLTEAA